ncbi:MAG: M36 family metallopeptidase [Bacteroidia bacterium]|nr:M36 family metallopeptidase [Bacteroidia bacterium]
MKKILTLLYLVFMAQVLMAHGDLHGDHDPALKRFMNDSKTPLDQAFQQQLRSQSGWQQFLQNNSNWWVQFNETNQKPHRAFGTPISLNINTNPAAAALYFLNNYVKDYLPGHVQLEYISAPVSRKYIQPNFIQKYNNLEVLWSRATVKMTPDYKVVMYGLDVYDDIAISTVPSISETQAIVAATAGLPSVITGVELDPSLKILPVPSYRKNNYHLVYALKVRTSGDGQTPDEYYTLVDAKDGKVLYRQDRIVSIVSSDVTVNATVYPTHPYNPTSIVNLPYLQINVGGTNYNTDVNGFINFPNTSTFNGTFTLQGPWAEVYTGANGTTLQSFTAALDPGTNTISFDNNSTIRHLSAYYHTNVVHDFMKNYLSNFSGLDFPISVKVERTDGTCNAFYDGGLNFYTTAGGCYALSMVADVVYHEYGHGITNVFWDDNGLNFSNGAMGEGYSDVWAIAITGNPVLGIGFSDTDPTSSVRDYDFNNNVSRKVYPQNIVGEVHADGEIIAGAWWSTSLLLGSLPLMTDIFTESHYGLANGPDGAEGQVYTDILIDALQADDNDANLSNGTPNAGPISQAFALHGITLLSNANLNHTPVTASAANTAITLNANLSNVQFAWALSGVKGAYRINNSTSWTPFTMTNTTGTNYTTTIPGQVDGTVIAYYIGIEDVNGTLSNVQPIAANVTANPNIPYFIMVGFNKIFTDDFDNTAGSWLEGLPTDGATTGMWEQTLPEQTNVNGTTVQPNTQITPGGIVCYVTGGTAGTGAGSFDVDGGATTITSPTYDLSGYLNPAFEYFRWYTNDQGATPGTDFWQVYISGDGINYIPVENTNVSDHSWRRFVFRVNDYLSPGSTTFTVRFVAEDANDGSLIEALMDEFSLYDALTTSIDEPSGFTALNAWPNPASEVLQVSCVLKNTAAVQLNISNQLGQVVYSEQLKLNAGKNDLSIPIRELSNGIYQLNFIGQNSNKNIKFTVIH